MENFVKLINAFAHLDINKILYALIHMICTRHMHVQQQSTHGRSIKPY